MTEAPFEDMRAHAEGTVGGFQGHLMRRMIHLAMMLIPFLYYWYGISITNWLSGLSGTEFSRDKTVVILLMVLIIGESLRVWSGITFFGQRDYEAKQVSALAWGGASICVCLLFAPKGGYNEAYIGLPIIFTLSLIDPLLGEGRRYLESQRTIAAAGLIVASAIWILSSIMLGTPLWLTLIMAPLSIAAEWPSLRYIDDNAMLVLIPLLAALVLQPLY